MRKGFWVCAKARRCQLFLPRKLPRPATSRRRVATLSSFETLAVYSRTSPARRGIPVSTGGAGFFESAGKDGKAGFTARALVGFSGGSASRKPGGSGDATSGGG